MPNTANPYITVEVPRTTVPPWRVAKVAVEEKGVLRLTRKLRQFLGVRAGEEVKVVPLGQGRILVIGNDRPRGLAELR